MVRTSSSGKNAPHNAGQSSDGFDLDEYLNDRGTARARIVDAAARLFCDRGFQVVTMKDISKAVGLSKAGLYHYCPSKDLILADIVTLCGKVLLRQLEVAQEEEGTPVNRLKKFVTTRMETIVEHQPLFTIIYQERPYLTSESIGDISRSAEEYRAGVRKLIEEAQSSGELDKKIDPHVLMFAIDGMTGWAYVWFRKDGTRTPTELGEAFWKILSSGVLADAS
ncbi:MAG: TetR/AcrR family transcriptional regulator [Alphaproteobacteria bacterium]